LAGQTTGPSAPRRHHGNRHGRSEDARIAILHAADDLLVEKGFAGVTIEGVAAAAGVSKQTIYRWWNSKTDILLDTFLADAAEKLVRLEQPTLAEDLRMYLGLLAAFLTGDDAGAVFRALIGHAQHDAAFAEQLRTHYLDEQRRRDRAPLDLAIARGELPADLDVPTAVDLLVGPLYHRILMTGDPVDESFIDQLVEHFVRGSS
jgi:AcrR family transcriptional regulator